MARTREERLQVMLSAEELAVIDDFRFQNRLPSRASAVREVLRRGLLAAGHALPGRAEHSSDFGVLSHEEQQER